MIYVKVNSSTFCPVSVSGKMAEYQEITGETYA